MRNKREVEKNTRHNSLLHKPLNHTLVLLVAVVVDTHEKEVANSHIR